MALTRTRTIKLPKEMEVRSCSLNQGTVGSIYKGEYDNLDPTRLKKGSIKTPHNFVQALVEFCVSAEQQGANQEQVDMTISQFARECWRFGDQLLGQAFRNGNCQSLI